MKRLDSLLCFTIRFDKQKHSGVCSGCDSGHRPMSPDTWTPPEPCPQCGYSDKMEDKKLLERYKVLVWLNILIIDMSYTFPRSV